MRIVFPLAVALALPLPLLAQDRPPADAMPLSQMLATLESGADFSHIDEVDWDDDGYYEVEYHTSDGREVKVRLDPVSGEPR